MADMKHRVAATEAMLSAAAQDGRERNERLLDFLERVEKNLVQKQEQISQLEKEQSRSLEENQLLRTLLNDMLTMAETTLERGSQVASDDLEKLIDRLGTIASTAKQDGEEVADSADAKDSDVSPLDSAKAADAKPAENAKDSEAEPAESAKDSEAKPAESAEKAHAAPARKRRVSKVLSLFGSA
jgi:hypothetical protein